MSRLKLEMAPKSSLPLQSCWAHEDDFIDSLLSFATSDNVFRNLCGGVHILDFLTRKPALYSTVLPDEWRQWLENVHIDDFLDLLLREDLNSTAEWLKSKETHNGKSCWRKYETPPQSLVTYIRTIRSFSLRRDISPAQPAHQPMPRHLTVGMKPKKIHEVVNFAGFVHRLAGEVECLRRNPVTNIVDFGSGQNYLGRTLASPPYCMHVTAIERRHHNIRGARGMDIYAKLAEKTKTVRNKKEYRKQLQALANGDKDFNKTADKDAEVLLRDTDTETKTNAIEKIRIGEQRGSVTYIEHELQDGRLEHLLRADLNGGSIDEKKHNDQAHRPPRAENNQRPQLVNGSSPVRASSTSTTLSNSMVVSLHSCGNLVHHGLRSLVLNPSVSAVAMVGCCYNLMTERLGPATYKLPILRPYHPRLQSTSEAYDPHGFPMSQRFETFEHKLGCGLRLNITARMMAVQAPYNWGSEDSQAFFTRHFYRALLQKILLDLGVVQQPDGPDSIVGENLSGIDSCGTPLIVGSLRKSCFTSFAAYVRGALAKLAEDPNYGEMVKAGTEIVTPEFISTYEKRFQRERKHLSVVWSLMAFSAGVVETLIAIDRWLFLCEQDCVEKCWIEPVFDYAQSPRNLVVVGIKRNGSLI